MAGHWFNPQLRGLRFRCIGPVRGGRVLAVSGHPTDMMTFYFGACAGGIWKTVDGGQYWENISDGFLDSASVGALTVSEADPNVIYAGMGESTIRVDVSYGDGVYKSTDGGDTWAHMGLEETNHISEIRVHPQDPDLVYVAALGHAFGPNRERGVYRSSDGGQNWELVLYKSEDAGAADLVLDSTNPRILFASIYETRRSFWDLSSGGEDCGLWKSVDGGSTWVDISSNEGFPGGVLGKIGVTLSPADPKRVWAIVECDDGVLYRSDDGGDTWTCVSRESDLIQRPWYYSHIFADPHDPETVYINNLKMWKSVDGGVTFSEMPTPHGDNHDLWLDPRDPQRMIQSNDGGANVSFNGGVSWSSIYNQKTAQFYHLVADNRHPYHVLGTQQDNTSIAVPSATEEHVIPHGACYTAGTGESGYIVSRPDDPDIVYIGAIGGSPGGGDSLQRYDHRTKQVQVISVWPEPFWGIGGADMEHRFAWTYPIVLSPHDNDTLYVAGNRIFKSTDEGHSWEPISPDLSRADESTLGVPGGPLTPDTSGAETFATVFAFAESRLERGVFWAGTDDGLVHFSPDSGATWVNITPPDLPHFTCITMIEPSTHDANTLYMAATRYKLDDYAPYLYTSSDKGKTWTKLNNFPYNEITRCVREDPCQEGLLFVGTETGVFFSPDGGTTWQPLQGGGPTNNQLPVVPIYDLVIKDDDLVIGTHGRSFWILDDITPLRDLAGQTPVDGFRLLEPRTTHRNWLTFMGAGSYAGAGIRNLGWGHEVAAYEHVDQFGEMRRQVLNGGENPPDGVIIYYLLPSGVEAAGVSLAILDDNGRELIVFSSLPDPATPVDSAPEQDPASPARHLPVSSGLNRFVWNMRLDDCVKPTNDQHIRNERTGPRVAPGRFCVQLTVGDEVQTHLFDVKVAPGVPASQADLNAQFELWTQINNKLTTIHEHVNKAVRVGEQLAMLRRGIETKVSLEGGDGSAKNGGELIEAIENVEQLLADVVGLLVDTSDDGGVRMRNPVRANAKLVELIGVVASADAAPTTQTVHAYRKFEGETDELLERLVATLETDVFDLNRLIKEAGIPAIMI